MKPKKELNNIEVARLLRAVAASYQIKNAAANKFKIIAYQRAADAVEHLSGEIKDLYDEGKLDQIPGVGPSLGAHLKELFTKGKSAHFEAVMSGIPPAVFELMTLPRVGPKTALKLVKGLNLKEKPIEALEKACREGKVASLEDFGEESQADILRSIEEIKNREKRMLLPYASSIAEKMVKWLKGEPACRKISALGSLRRQVSTIGDIDIAVASSEPEKVINRFINYSKKERILEKGEKAASLLLTSEIQVDLKVVEPASWGSLLQHFTGSKHHNIALREYAQSLGLSLSEYGIKNLKNGLLQTFETEEKFYRYLRLEYIPPEIREDTGEIKTAKQKQLPKLVEVKDIKGDLQIHSDFNVETSHDLGESSFEDLVRKGSAMGYEYLAFTEHNPSHSRHSESEVLEILKKKQEAVALLNQKLTAIKMEQFNCSKEKATEIGVKKVFNSLEIDILPTGKLAIPEEGLKLLDFALVSIHSSFRQDKETVTKRILSALAYPEVKILAHPTARKINEREGIDADWLKIFEFCRENKKWLEINADPIRLDLPDFLVKEALGLGIKFTLGTDAHHQDGLENMKWGVAVARRGWVEKDDIINSRSLTDLEKLLSED